MSSGSSGVIVKKVLKKIVDDVVKELENDDELLDEANTSIDAGHEAGDSEIRRSGRSRKEPDRLAAKKAGTSKQSKPKTKKEDPFTCEVVMDPPPPDLRGILKPDRDYPPPRKSSLSAKAGKSIANKYRKVRVSRRLQYKVIPPLPGWRADRTRMPEDEPDEEEQQRIEEQEAKEKREAQAAQKKKRKRKSIGAVPAVPSVSEDDMTIGGEEISGNFDVTTPASPDVFYEDYMKVNTPDSVLTTDSEADERREERRKAVSHALFAPIEERPIDEQAAGTDTVAADDGGDTVAATQPVARKERRRSVRIQERDQMRRSMFLSADVAKKDKETQPGNEPPEEEKEKPAAEKKERRKSKMFPVTPLKDSPAPKETKPVEKSVRRRSGVVRPVPAKKEEASTSRNPYNDDPCRTEEEKAAASAHNAERKKKKVMAWLEREDTAVEEDLPEGGGGAGEEEVAEAPEQHSAMLGDEIESVRGTDSRESQFSEKASSSNTQLVEAKSEQSKRKGRRSMKMSREDVVSKSKSKSEKEEEKKTKPHHPFFSQFAPKSSPVVDPPKPEATAPPAEKKQAVRRRSMFAPKKPLAGRKGSASPPMEEKEKKRVEEEEEDAIEIVAEITKEKREEERDASSQPTAVKSIWRSTEIDAAPYAGLVHVGRDEETVAEAKEEGEEGSEGVVKKMRRLSMRLPRVSSYAIPASLRAEESEPAEMVPVFDDGKRTEGLSERAAALARRAAAATAAADASVGWPEAMRPRRVEECLGDQEVLASGKRWLQKWKKRLDRVCAEEERATKAPKAKKRKRRGGNYSDESEQEDSDSDYDMGEEGEHRLPNPLVLSGPIGCGKTAYIRALSEEVGFSLLESAPDESRTGAALRAKLAGAVANFRMSSKPLGGIASFFGAKSGGEEKKKEEEGKRGKQHTLVVIEHVDVIFTEHDKLFWPALAEILATTKIPIALTCNVVPDELSRLLQTAEETGAEPLEIAMQRGEGGRRVEEYVEASLAGSSSRALSTTVIPAIAARARQDLRAALYDAHWAAAAGTLRQADLLDSSARRVDEPAVCDTVAAQPFAWSDECARRAAVASTSALSRVAEWPARCGMPGADYGRLCKEIDEIDQDACREAEARANRMMEMARSGVGAGSGGRTGLLSHREIATDWMPMLEQIDRREQEKKRERGRRYQHYFNVIRNLETGVSIDPLDRIQGACAFFRLPPSTELQ